MRQKIDIQALTSFIEDNKKNHDIKLLCETLQISRSTYYDRRSRKKSNRALENEKFLKKIMSIYLDNKKRYGAPKIRQILKSSGWLVSLKRVQRLMKKLGIRSIVHKKFKHHSSKCNDKIGENIINRDFSTTSINEKWVTDITYIYTIKDGWCYLASIMDLYTRKIIGYSFSKSMTTKLTIKALEKALENTYFNQRPNGQVIIHSDRGSQV
ncbi:IS3 family transposase [Clostridium sp. D2Q-14]|uniref:IS3 family transposase n=1 Tax=Anaeromonas gelatinilytica TaxID=2683194 RepID=UPI00193BFB9D|nr:IS3 family transposase [Anaeromonas gelatinilytica]